MAKQLAKTLEKLNELYGDNTVFKLGQVSNLDLEWIPTEIPQIDAMLGGGFPKGRIVEIFGPEGSGKTTLALWLAAKAQGKNSVAYIDMEHSVNPAWATKLGVKINDLFFAQPNYAEEALDIVEKLIETDQFGLIIVDSVAALVPKNELEGEVGDAHVGLQARLMSQFMRRNVGRLLNSKTCLVFINQIRMKIGEMWGNPETTAGGLALKYYASIRLNLKKKKVAEEKGVPVSVQTKATCIKNKVAEPFKDCMFDILFTGGIK